MIRKTVRKVVKKKVRKEKKDSISKLKQKVWVEFSRYIRQRDSDWRGYARCVTCPTYAPWQSLQAGHFIPGRKNSILFDERHVHAQCARCNVFLHGNLIAYYPFMIEKHGQEVIDELKELNRTDKQFTNSELQSLYAKYKALNERFSI